MRTNDRLELFCRGLVNPGIIAINVVALHRGNIWLVFAASFAISYIWAGSVKAIAAAGSTQADKEVYALGAGCGGVLGLILGRWLA